ncbi:MAG: CDP-alcohol phosphatidyltransferase family protein [Candidatus Micrarchaeia archaeon]
MGLKTALPEFAEGISNKLGLFFARWPLTPNQWTVLSVLPALAGFGALVYGHMAAGIVLFALSAVIDAIDGGVARMSGAVTRLGAFLDGVMDRVVEALLLFGLMFSGLVADWMLPAQAWIALLLFAGTAMTSYVRAYAHHRKAIADERKLASMGGVLERSERLMLVFAGMVAWFAQPIYLTYALAAASLLACLTVLQRIWFVVKNAE